MGVGSWGEVGVAWTCVHYQMWGGWLVGGSSEAWGDGLGALRWPGGVGGGG